MTASRRLHLTAAMASLVLVSMMVVRTSSAAFTDTTANSANQFDFASIALTDNDASAVMFDIADMVPGDSETHCIRVTYTGAVAVDVKVYNTAITDGSSVAQHLDMTIEEGTDSLASAGLVCTVYTPDAAAIVNTDMNTWATGETSFATGSGAWSPASTGSKDYRVVITLGADTPDGAQGASVTGVEFTWEAQTP